MSANARAPRPFVGWDGEGATVRGRHKYTLFASSTGLELERSQGLRAFDGLALLALGMQEFRGIHVGFAIGYDVNLLLRGLPRAALARIWEGERVFWSDRGRRFGVEWRPRKYLWIRYWPHQIGGEWKGRGAGGILWDCWPFFQTGFVVALEKYGVGTPAEHERLRAMKAARATFTKADAAAVREYNRLELRLLVALMEALRESVTRAGVVPARWDGPGAIAALMLRREETARRASARVPEPALDAFQYAYYGGRIEAAQYGRHRGPVYQYDLNSAYPWAMGALPCRAPGCGQWIRRTTGFSSARLRGRLTFSVHHVRWSFPRGRRFYPLPWRSHTGAVYFPREGEGWAWTPELLQAETAGGELELLKSWEWVSTCSHQDAPYAWVGEAYERRQEAKRAGDAAEHALKLGLNSLYGKLAQRIGAEEQADGSWTIPPFHDLAGAGFITSAVRARMYAAAMLDPTAVVMLATDGIFTTRALPLETPAGKPLGAWDGKVWDGVTVVQSGVYWLDDPEGGEPRIYSRGFDAESLEREAVLAAWRQGAASLEGAQTRFVGLGMALRGRASSPAGRAAFRSWCQWVTDPKALSLAPWGTKREPLPGRRDPSRGLVPTRPADTSAKWSDPAGAGRMTTPSPVPWRPLVGAQYGDGDREARALAESDEAGL